MSVITGVVIKSLNKIEDNRGWLMEAWRNDWSDIKEFPVMAYVSMTNKGIVRGPHEHQLQTDCFVFIGKFRLRLWDSRRSTPTNGVMMNIVSNTPIMVIVPAGVVHAYAALEDNALCINLPDELYRGRNGESRADEIRHENSEDNKYNTSDLGEMI